MASGEMDLEAMLMSLTVQQRPGRFAFVSIGPDSAAPLQGIQAVVQEHEGWTVVAEAEEARRRGWAFDFEAAWLTLEVHSSLEAVGLTAAVSTALASARIPCNMLAGFYHDHLLVPYEAAQDASDCIDALRQRSTSEP